MCSVALLSLQCYWKHCTWNLIENFQFDSMGLVQKCTTYLKMICSVHCIRQQFTWLIAISMLHMLSCHQCSTATHVTSQYLVSLKMNDLLLLYNVGCVLGVHIVVTHCSGFVCSSEVWDLLTAPRTDLIAPHTGSQDRSEKTTVLVFGASHECDT